MSTLSSSMVFHSFWSDWRWQQWSHHLLSILHLREDFSSDIKIIKTHMELLISHYCDKELDDTGGCFLAVVLIPTSHITHTNTHTASDLHRPVMWFDSSGWLWWVCTQLLNKKTHILARQPHISEDHVELQPALVWIPDHMTARYSQKCGEMGHVHFIKEKYSQFYETKAK